MKTAGWDCSGAPATPCANAAGAVFPTLNLVTTNNNTIRANATLIIKQDLAALGIPVNIDGQYYPASALFGDYTHNGILATGKYGLALFAYVFWIDTDDDLSEFASDQTPGIPNPSGGNFERVHDPEIDQALQQARITVNPEQRSQLYKEVQRLLITRVYFIPLFLRPNITLTAQIIGNYFDNPFAGNLWNVGDWFVNG